MKGIKLDWIFLDAGNTLVHIDFTLVTEVLKREFKFEADAGKMAEAEPAARALVDLGEKGDERERWRSYFFQILSAGGWKDRARIGEVVRAIFARHKVFNLWCRPAREAEATLGHLRKAGFRCAVISNSDGSVEAELGRLGMAKHLDFIIDSHVVGIEKPDPRIFKLALEKSGADPARSLYVGDMFHIDVVGARGAGLHAALLDPVGIHSHRDCTRLREIADLPSLLS